MGSSRASGELSDWGIAVESTLRCFTYCARTIDDGRYFTFSVVELGKVGAMLVEATVFDVSYVVEVDTCIPYLFIIEVRVLRVDTANIRVVIFKSERCRAFRSGAVA